MKSLLGAVIDTRNAGQSEEAGDACSHLVVVGWDAVGRNVADAFSVVVIVEKGDEKARGIAMRTEDVLLDLLPVVVHCCDALWCALAFHGRPEIVVERVVESGVD